MKATYLSCLLLTISWAGAQDLASKSDQENQLLINPMDLPDAPVVDPAPGFPRELVSQDVKTLDLKTPSPGQEEMPELMTIRKRSVYHLVSRSESIPVSSVNGERIGKDLQTVSAAYRSTGQKETECVKPALSVAQRIQKKPEKLLQIVDVELRANPDCACEIVKAAIRASDMKTETVVAIVKVAIEANPESMRLVAQCAIAASPESLTAIQDLLSKYGASLEGYSAKSAKGEKAAIGSDEEVAAAPNPLDFPGGPQGGNLTPDVYNLDLVTPPYLIVTPPTTTFVDP